MKKSVKRNYYKQSLWFVCVAELLFSAGGMMSIHDFLNNSKIINYTFIEIYGYFILTMVTPILFIIIGISLKQFFIERKIIDERILKIPYDNYPELKDIDQQQINIIKEESKVFKLKILQQRVSPSEDGEYKIINWQVSLSLLCGFYSSCISSLLARLNNNQLYEELKCTEDEFIEFIKEFSEPGKEPLVRALGLGWKQWPRELKYPPGRRGKNENILTFQEKFGPKSKP